MNSSHSPRPDKHGLSTLRAARLLALCALCLLALQSARAQTLRADYRFRNTRASSVGPSTLADAGAANSFQSDTVDNTTRTTLRFGTNAGLSLSPSAAVMPNDTYTIVMLFRLDSTSGFVRLVDFRNRQSDDGLYIDNGSLENCQNCTGIPANTYVQVVYTRGADDVFRAYVNGTLQGQGVDSDKVLTIDGSGTLRFFQDDTVFGGEASAGNVARIRIYDAPLTQAQVAALDRLPASPSACSAPGFSQSTLTAGTNPRFVAVGDFNADARPDLAVANETSNNVSIFLGNGNGTFGAATNFAAGGSFLTSIAVADFNADGRPDLVTANTNTNNVSVLLGAGNGTFGAAAQYTAGSLPVSVAAGDFNSDRMLDIIVANRNSNATLLFGNGDGTFGGANPIASGSSTYVAVADFNNDSRSDLALSPVGTAFVRVMLGNGNGTFGAATNFGVNQNSNAVAVGDFNGDGRPDLVTASDTENSVSVLIGIGNGIFSAATHYTVGLRPFDITVADLDNDGHPDLATASANSGAISVLIGTGVGTFGTATNFGVGGASPTSVTAADLNADGKTDLAATKFNSNVSVLLNTCAASTLTVANTNDSGAGSLRQAIIDANAAPGTQTIAFQIPGGGVKTIMPLSALPTVTDPVIIDGTTQPGYAGSPLIELSGVSAGAGVNGLMITAGNSRVKGLVINRFGNDGILLQTNGGNIIEGNFIGTDASGAADLGNTASGVDINVSSNNIIGGTAAGARNVISGNNSSGIFIRNSSSGNQIQGNYIGANAAGTAAVRNGIWGISISSSPNNTVGGAAAAARNIISGNGDLNDPPDGCSNGGIQVSGSNGGGNIVQGNFIGTDASGANAMPNCFGVVLSTNANTVGGTAAGARNVISGNESDGIFISSNAAAGNIIQGNYIGANAAGTAPLGNGFGILVTGPNNVIGGTAAGAGNLISGSTGTGILLSSSATGNLMQGNLIGTDPSGTAAWGNGTSGIFVSGSNNTIGGTAAGTGNRIAFNGLDGVSLNNGTGNRVNGNSIHSNGTAAQHLGIDISPDGVTPNDGGDVDTGVNNLQNFPLLSAATTDGGSLALQGTLNSAASATFRVEFFSNAACDASGNGEGQTFLGSASVTTDAGGNATINTSLPVAVPVGQFITATATDPNGNTSEFSACRQAVAPSTLSISGRVTDRATQAGLADVFVTLSGTLTRVVKTDAQGNYSFTGLSAGGDYTVTPQSPYYEFAGLRHQFPGLAASQTANFTTSRPTPPTGFPPPTDDFGGPTRDPDKWNLGTLTQPGAFNAAVTVTQAGGALAITPSASSAGYNGYVSVNSFDLTNGAAGVELVQAGAGATETIFAVGQDSDNFFRFLVRENQTQTPAGKGAPLIHWLSADALVLSFQVKVNGVTTLESIPYDPVAHKFLRFRHDGAQNSINFETSPDASAWTVRRSFSLAGTKGAAGLTCELSAGVSAPGASAGQTVFDNFNLTTNTVRFKVASTRVSEQSGKVDITVRREGSTAGSTSVTYQTSADTAAAGSDFQAAQGTLQFAAGEVEKSFSVQLPDDTLMEGDESFDVLLGAPNAAGLDSPGRHRVTISDNEASIDDARFFARQHYLDFFSREPDQAGWDFWAGQITECGTDAGCIDVRRQNVSGAFFLSIEFQETGFLVYRAHKASFGNLPGVSWPLTMQTLLADMGQIGAGVIVGQGDWQARLEANKVAYFATLVQTQRFVQQYPQTLTPQQFVSKLNQNAGAALDQAEADDLASKLTSGQLTRAQVVRAVAEDQTLHDAEYRKAFVYMQYVGYLRRDPDQLGFDFWLTKLNNHNGDYISSEMIRSFIVSSEYRGRFGQ